jgi:hypothetical protein
MANALKSGLAALLLASSTYASDANSQSSHPSVPTIAEYVKSRGTYEPAHEEQTDFGKRTSLPYTTITLKDSESNITYELRVAKQTLSTGGDLETFILERYDNGKLSAWYSESLPDGSKYKLTAKLAGEPNTPYDPAQIGIKTNSQGIAHIMQPKQYGVNLESEQDMIARQSILNLYAADLTAAYKLMQSITLAKTD